METNKALVDQLVAKGGPNPLQRGLYLAQCYQRYPEIRALLLNQIRDAIKKALANAEHAPPSINRLKIIHKIGLIRIPNRETVGQLCWRVLDLELGKMKAGTYACYMLANPIPFDAQFKQLLEYLKCKDTKAFDYYRASQENDTTRRSKPMGLSAIQSSGTGVLSTRANNSK